MRITTKETGTWTIETGTGTLATGTGTLETGKKWLLEAPLCGLKKSCRRKEREFTILDLVLLLILGTSKQRSSRRKNLL